jgi:hypothetical protein
MNNHWMRWLVVSAAVVTLAAPGLAGPAQASPLPSPSSPWRAAAAGGAIRGGGLEPGLGPAVPGRLTGVAATSADDVWAVGLTSGPPLVLHWNGSSWLQYPISPDLYFLGVAAVSPRDAWAVGGTYWFAPTATVAYHWNGKTWGQVPTPAPDGSAFFSGVAATSAANAWAVGDTGPGPGGPNTSNAPLIERWNGRAWTQQSDGSTWQRMPAPAGTPAGSWLDGVAATGPGDAWAVGGTSTTGPDKSLILHWNGRRWAVVASPTPAGDTNLLAVAASSQRNAWTVGYSRPTSCSPECQTVAERWNGRLWAVVPTPNPRADFLDAFLGVVAISGHDAWAVGTTDWATTLIAHWNGHSWG